MTDNENNNAKLAEDMKTAFGQFYRAITCMCPQCIHNEVCILKETADMPCKAFVSNGDYKQYGNINNLFQPIFEWMQYHYPSGEVIFIVDNTSAKMHLEHGATAYSKNLCGFANPMPTMPETDKPKEQ